MFDEIMVSTDSERYAAIAKEYGAEAPFIRPAEISGKDSTDPERSRKTDLRLSGGPTGQRQEHSARLS